MRGESGTIKGNGDHSGANHYDPLAEHANGGRAMPETIVYGIPAVTDNTPSRYLDSLIDAYFAAVDAALDEESARAALEAEFAEVSRG
jgi:hypothetical protein